MMTIHPPAPAQKAMIAKISGMWEGTTTWLNESIPRALSRKFAGLAVGSSRKSQSMTLDAPASAPGR